MEHEWNMVKETWHKAHIQLQATAAKHSKIRTSIRTLINVEKKTSDWVKRVTLSIWVNVRMCWIKYCFIKLPKNKSGNHSTFIWHNTCTFTSSKSHFCVLFQAMITTRTFSWSSIHCCTCSSHDSEAVSSNVEASCLLRLHSFYATWLNPGVKKQNHNWIALIQTVLYSHNSFHLCLIPNSTMFCCTNINLFIHFTAIIKCSLVSEYHKKKSMQSDYSR